MRYLTPTLLALCLLLTACGTQGDCQNPPGNEAAEASDANSDGQENNETPESSDETSDNSTDEDSERIGSSATSCGAPSQGLEPVDCTMHGDTDAFCVYGNHCYCNRDAGFQCEESLLGENMQECSPGSTCVPIED